MPYAIRVHRHGGPDCLVRDELVVPEPGPGEARIHQRAIGVNFIDVYQRTGLYPVPLPAVLGQEAAGVVEAVGPGVTEVAVGDRVAYAGVMGAYAEVRTLPAERLVITPDCGLVRLHRDVAFGKLSAMVEGTKAVRKELGR